ncbi:hypothetical protein SPPR111872_17350 [Sphingobacterium prati]
MQLLFVEAPSIRKSLSYPSICNLLYFLLMSLFNQLSVKYLFITSECLLYLLNLSRYDFNR